MKLFNKKIFYRLLLILIGVLFLFNLLNFLFPLPLGKIPSKEILAEDGTLLSAYLTNDDKWRMNVKLDNVSPKLIKSIIEKEDKYFYWHLGFNPISILNSFSLNIKSGRIISGASTITMQLARLLEPAERTYFNKILEIFRAVQIEGLYSKGEILEMYLNYLPYGGNIEGIKSASYIYFNSPPDKLSLAQAITLTIIPNDPNSFRMDRNIDLLLNKRNLWIDKFSESNIFVIEDLIDARNEPIKSVRYDIPKLAPHFCNRLKSDYSNNEIHSSLNVSKQQTAENILKNYVDRFKNIQISNGAVLVVDNKNNQVVAYCGSADYNDVSSAGQVDGVRSIRSPGSTLKPFLYSQAFDRGLLTPKMKLLDIPMDFSGYEPENYDKKFYGEVSAEFALKNSLNIPAVQLLQNVNITSFIQLLSKTGFNKIYSDKGKLGLSLILGGCGTSLEEIVGAFTSFAHNGKFKKLIYCLNEDKGVEVKIFSEESSYLITNILSDLERPDFPSSFIGESKLPRVAWKTGTSYGKRDAWAIGTNPRYTIGIWLGNFDGKGSPYLNGTDMAVPLLFELFNAIDYDSDKKWFDMPDKLFEREVCASTGFLPSSKCSTVVWDYYIEGASSNKKCNRMQNFMIDEKMNITYCPDCLGKNDYTVKSFPVLEPELKLFFMQNKIPFDDLPPHNLKCNFLIASNGPEIISPSEDYEYFIDRENKQKILLQAVSSKKVDTYYWYIDDKFYKKSIPGKNLFFEPKNDLVRIVCSDNKGGSSELTIRVKYY